MLQSTETTISQSPAKDWKKFDILNFVLYGLGWLLYLINGVFNSKGKYSLLGQIFVYTTNFLTAAPFLVIIMLVSVASSYGSTVEVATNTSWSTTIADDPYYKTFFWGIFATQIGQIVISLLLNKGIGQEYKDALYLQNLILGGCTNSKGKPEVCSSSSA